MKLVVKRRRRHGRSGRSRPIGALGATVSACLLVTTVMAPVAQAALAAQAAVTVPCSSGVGDAGALVAAFSAAAARPSSTIDLVTGCTYTLSAVATTSANGDDGLSLVTTQVAVNGNGATITRDPSAVPFRILEVAASGWLQLN